MGKFLITGGAGFIGTKTSELLVDGGHDVRIIDSFSAQVHDNPDEAWRICDAKYDVIRGDICDSHAIEKALQGVDGVLHLAAETGVGQSMYEIANHTNTNIQGTSVLLQAIKNSNDKPKKIVLASSRAVYGEGEYSCKKCNLNMTPMPRVSEDLDQCLWEPVCQSCGSAVYSKLTTELSERKPSSIYAISKQVQEDLINCICTSLGMESVSLRYFNVYGEGQSLTNPYTGILTTFITQLKNGTKLSIYEDGQESRDFVHVDDVARANVLALESGLTQHAINVGSGVRVSIGELARKMAVLIGSSSDIVVTGEYRVGDIRHCIADTTLAGKELNFSASIDLNDGLARFVEWGLTQNKSDVSDRAYQELVNNGLLGNSSK